MPPNVPASWTPRRWLHYALLLAAVWAAASLAAAVAPPVVSALAAAAAWPVAGDRSPSLPLLTGDTLRSHADHLCDETGCALASPASAASRGGGSLRAGQVVFVDVGSLARWLGLLAARTGAGEDVPAHIVVAHNGDSAVDGAAVAALATSPRVCALYAQNIAASASAAGSGAGWKRAQARLRALPIGFENRRWSNGRCLPLYAGMPTQAGLREVAAAGEALRHALALLGALAPAAGCTTAASSKSDDVALASLLSPARKLVFAAFNLVTNAAVRGKAAASLAGLAAVTVQIEDAPPEVQARAASTGAAATALPPLDAPALRELAARVAAWDVGAPPTCDRVDVVTASPPPPAGISEWAVSALRSCHSARDHIARATAFFSGMAAHPFVASPPGNGLQSHRTWEALVAGRVPVVLRTSGPMDDLYMGLPVLLVDGWSEDERLEAGADAALVGHEMLLGVLLRLATVARNTARLAAGAAGARARPLDPRLLSRRPDALAAEERDALAGATLHMERLHAGHWLALIDAQRARCHEEVASGADVADAIARS